MAQIMVPTSDIAAGSWTTAPLFSKVDDDSTVNPTGDGTVINSDNNSSPDNADFGLTDPSTPDTGDHILRARWNRDQAASHSIHGTLELWQGTPGSGTLIATLTSAQPIETTEVEDTYTLSGTEVGNITDYSGLALRVSRIGGVGGPGGNREFLIVDLIELEIPDAAAAPAFPEELHILKKRRFVPLLVR